MERESLADYVRRIRNEKRLSTGDVHLRSSHIPDQRIAKSHISRIENGISKNPTTETLRALAKGLDVSEDEIFAIARGKAPRTEEELRQWKYAALFDSAKKLTPEQVVKFEAVMEYVEHQVAQMLKEQEKNAIPRRKSKKA
jgi:transcriptional regulator with XRE-family HTH domain